MLGSGSRSKSRGDNPLVTLLEYLPIRRGSEGSQKPFSRLSEGVKCIFTICTEDGEITCVPLHILGTTMSSWLVQADILQEILLVTFVVTLGRR
jgi:hypothetical protein